MKANGKRIGRLDGKLDDLLAQVESYAEHEARHIPFDHVLWEHLSALKYRLEIAHLAAQDVLDHLNRPQ